MQLEVKGLLMLRKETESGVVNLSGDEPEITKLLVQYLYETEYHSGLPTGSQVKTSTTAPPREVGYHYDFPHSCDADSSGWGGFSCTKKHVCPHHRCADTTWDICCLDFSCKFCTAPSTRSPPAGEAEDLLLHAKMYETGDKYEVVGLKDFAKDEFEASCKQFWSTPSFAVAARHVFSTTVENDKGLRDIVSATISEHLKLVDDPEVGAVMTEFNGLALDILRATIAEQEKQAGKRREIMERQKAMGMGWWDA